MPAKHATTKPNPASIFIGATFLDEDLGLPSAAVDACATKYGVSKDLAWAKTILDSSGSSTSWQSHKFNRVGKQNSPLPHSKSLLQVAPQWPRAEVSS